MSDERSVQPGRPEPAAPGEMPGESADDADQLLSRLKLIEDQPLETRAEAYAHIHDELRTALDDADRQGGR